MLPLKRRVYVETSVVSYFTARPSRDVVVAGHQHSTQRFWPKLGTDFEAFVSALVYQEASRGDREQARRRLAAIASMQMLDVDDDARTLAETILAERGVPSEYPEDALHLAVATVNGMDVVVTWNFAHLNNPFTRTMIRQIIENEGFRCPEVCSPDELLETGQ